MCLLPNAVTTAIFVERMAVDSDPLLYNESGGHAHANSVPPSH